ncbi:hypothetical protein [Desulfurobacterium crinifex]
MNRVELYAKDGTLIAGWDVDWEICNEFSSLTNEEIVFEVVNLLIINLKEETGMDFTPNMIISELSRIVICGREIDIEGGNPAH